MKKPPKRRNTASHFRAPEDLVAPGGARYYMRDNKIEEDEDVMEGLLAADRVMSLAMGRAPPGRNSRIDKNEYDTSDYVTDLISVGRAGGVALHSRGSGRSDRKQRAITGISGSMEGHGASAFRVLASHRGDISAKRERKNPAKRNPYRSEMIRKGGAVYGYGVWDIAKNDYVRRANGEPQSFETAGKASAFVRRRNEKEAEGGTRKRATVSQARARQILEQAKGKGLSGPWADNLVMSPAERRYVNAIWNRMGGSTSFTGALLNIANGRVPAKGRVNPSKIEVEFIRRLPALVVVGRGKNDGNMIAHGIRTILGDDLPRLRIVVTVPPGVGLASAANVAAAEIRNRSCSPFRKT